MFYVLQALLENIRRIPVAGDMSCDNFALRCHELCGQWAVPLPVAAGHDPVRDKLVVWRTFS